MRGGFRHSTVEPILRGGLLKFLFRYCTSMSEVFFSPFLLQMQAIVNLPPPPSLCHVTFVWCASCIYPTKLSLYRLKILPGLGFWIKDGMVKNGSE